MRINKLYIVLGLLIAFVMLFELAAHADDMNESTEVTFSAPRRETVFHFHGEHGFPLRVSIPDIHGMKQPI